MSKSFKIGRHVVGGGKAFVIAEVAQAHDGSLGMAHAFIDLAAECGADAVKFQTHIADAESTLDEKFRVPLSGQDATRYDYWKRMEFTPEQWAALAKHAAQKKLVFLSSAFSLEAVRLLEKISMPAWKVGSGEFASQELMQAMIRTKKPVLFSTGMCNSAEIHGAVKAFGKVPYALLQCTSLYPAPLDKVGLNVIGDLKKKYGCPVGLSDHSSSPFPALAALARGADIIEAHITFHKGMYGPDVPASLTPQNFKQVCDFRDALAVMDANPVNKDAMAREMAAMRGLFGKSIAPARKLKAGTVIAENMLAAKKPGTGIPYAERAKIIGLKLVKDVSPERLLKWEDINRRGGRSKFTPSPLLEKGKGHA